MNCRLNFSCIRAILKLRRVCSSTEKITTYIKVGALSQGRINMKKKKWILVSFLFFFSVDMDNCKK